MLAGKPLIAHTIATAQAYQAAFGNVTIALSTDDLAIKEAAAAGVVQIHKAQALHPARRIARRKCTGISGLRLHRCNRSACLILRL